MNRPYKPPGYTSVSAYVVTQDARRVIDFLARTFDAHPLRRHDRPDGSVMHAEVRIDDTVVMIADGGAAFPPAPACLHVYVPDVDAAYQRALDAGATSLQAPEQKDDPDRRAGVKDPAGNSWWMATQVG